MQEDSVKASNLKKLQVKLPEIHRMGRGKPGHFQKINENV
jgi:hypothetical protein